MKHKKENNYIKLQASGYGFHEKGFTLVELFVSMTIFVILISMAVGIFVITLRSQRAAVALMEVNDNASLTLEQMMREMRTGSNFNNIGNGIYFTSASGHVVYYHLNGNYIERAEDSVDNYTKITADDINVKELSFNIKSSSPPLIVINISVGSTSSYIQGVLVNVQTSVSPIFF